MSDGNWMAYSSPLQLGDCMGLDLEYAKLVPESKRRDACWFLHYIQTTKRRHAQPILLYIKHLITHKLDQAWWSVLWNVHIKACTTMLISSQCTSIYFEWLWFLRSALTFGLHDSPSLEFIYPHELIMSEGSQSFTLSINAGLQVPHVI